VVPDDADAVLADTVFADTVFADTVPGGTVSRMPIPHPQSRAARCLSTQPAAGDEVKLDGWTI
jgi:hypothetical protein